MTACTLPPAGWICSWEPGHEGSCAARSSRPYDEYINRTMSELENRKDGGSFRDCLIDAWMDGLKYSLVMIEGERRRRGDR